MINQRLGRAGRPSPVPRGTWVAREIVGACLERCAHKGLRRRQYNTAPAASSNPVEGRL